MWGGFHESVRSHQGSRVVDRGVYCFQNQKKMAGTRAQRHIHFQNCSSCIAQDSAVANQLPDKCTSQSLLQHLRPTAKTEIPHPETPRNPTAQQSTYQATNPVAQTSNPTHLSRAPRVSRCASRKSSQQPANHSASYLTLPKKSIRPTPKRRAL